jgi:hypothetical protein
MSEAESQPIAAPQQGGRRLTMALLAIAGVMLIALGVVYQPINQGERVLTNIESPAAVSNEKAEFTIDSATGKVEQDTGAELRQLLSLVEKEREEARNNYEHRQLSKGKGGSSGGSDSGKGKGSKSDNASKGSKSSKTSAPTTTPSPSESAFPTAPTSMPSGTPSEEGTGLEPTGSPAPSESAFPTGVSKSSKSGSAKGKGDDEETGSSKSSKRERRLLQE